MIAIRIPDALRDLANGADNVAVEGSNVREALAELGERHPQITPKILDYSGNIRRWVNIYADAEDIRFLENMETELSSGSELLIVSPPVEVQP